MKLRREVTCRRFPSYSSRGRWLSADGRFLFFRRAETGWGVRVVHRDGLETEKKTVLYKQDCEQMQACGITGTIFATRRQAVAALELMLAGIGGKP